MIRFFTWYDIETEFEDRRLSWPESWRDVRVYSDCVVIDCRQSAQEKEKNCQYLKEIFTKNYNIQQNKPRGKRSMRRSLRMSALV